MSKCCVIADLHLGHRKIIEYEPARRIFATIEEHDAEIERRWREVVHSRDVVYVLGDVAWNRVALERLRSFPGIKKLVMGNHDLHDMRAYLEVFRKITAYAEVSGWLLAHMPVHSASIVPRFRGQIHGHLHGTSRYRKLNGVPYLNAGAEALNFRPWPIEHLIQPVMQLPPIGGTR